MSISDITKIIEAMKRPLYLGDGVEASFDGYQIWLKTFDGYEFTNQIAIEPEVQRALIEYFNWIDSKTREIFKLREQHADK